MSNPDYYGVMQTATITDRHGSQWVANSWAQGTDTGFVFCPQLGTNHLPPARIGGALIEPIIDDAPFGAHYGPQFAYAYQVTDSNANKTSTPTDTGLPFV